MTCTLFERELQNVLITLRRAFALSAKKAANPG
jgi:hypothetical protein